MDPQSADLTGLSREPGPVAVPLPPVRWRTRIALPAVVVIASAVIIVLAAWDVLNPGRTVEVVPVIVKAGDPSVAETTSVVVQAPGWVEADPFPIAVSALTDGVVAEVLVLEGQRVELASAGPTRSHSRVALATGR